MAKGTAYFREGSRVPYLVIVDGNADPCPWCLGRGYTYGTATTVPVSCGCCLGFLNARITDHSDGDGCVS